MSLNTPSRRALATGFRHMTAGAGAAAAVTTTPCLALRPQTPRPRQQPQCGSSGGSTRPLHTTAAHAFDWRGLFGRRKKPAANTQNSLSDGLAGNLESAKTRQELRERMTSPGLDASPFLASEMEHAGVGEADLRDGAAGARGSGGGGGGGGPSSRNDIGASLLPSDLQRALDPDPRSRVRWERKMVIRHVGRLLDPKGHETRDERLARTERALLHKSMPIPTSTKKLMHLARQISGKTLEEALVQMRFSKKKMAKEVMWHLQEARDMAVVERGMGLGRAQKKKAKATAEAAAGSSEAENGAALTIQTKDGRWLAITDPTRIYIDQAWVGKGQWRTSTPEYRARGRRFIQWSPSSFLSVVLKEEKTRIRLHDERRAKEARKAPWVHLPNRPVTAQRPYYSW